MRAKLVQGTNATIWANSVLPTFMRDPRGCQLRETTQFMAVAVQIDTKPNRPETHASAGFSARHKSINRTVVSERLVSSESQHGVQPSNDRSTRLDEH
jgi:hypothetical protein